MTNRILVTGGLGDIGTAIATKFAAHHWQVALNDLRPHSEETPSSWPYYAADNTDPAAVEAMLMAIVHDIGVPHIVAINAGRAEPMLLLDSTVAQWQRHLDLNLTGAFLVAQSAARAMRTASQPGLILFTSSWVQDVPSYGIGAYCVSKAKLKMLARQLALELAADGIRVNLVAPGVVDAGLSGQMFRSGRADPQTFIKAIPLHQIQTASQVADAFWLLAQPEAAYLTGTTLLTDGGMSLYNWQK